MALKMFSGGGMGSASALSSQGGTYDLTNTTNVRSGTYAIRLNPTGTGTGWVEFQGIDTDGMPTSLALSDAYYSGYERIDTLPSANLEPIFSFMSPGSARKLTVCVNSSGYIVVLDRNDSTVETATTGQITAGTYFKLDVRGGNGTSANYEVRIDGTTVASGTCNQMGNAVGALRIGKVFNVNGEDLDMKHDVFAIDDAGFQAPDIEVSTVVAEADGSTMEFVAGTGSTYAETTQIPDQISSYLVSSGSAGDQALFDFPSASSAGITGTILGVILIVRLRAPSGTQDTDLRIRSGSTNLDSTGHDTTSTAVTRRLMALVDPDTSAAWLTAGIDGIEAGVVENNATAETRLAHVSLHILFVPASGAPATTGYPGPTAVLGTTQSQGERGSTGYVTATQPTVELGAGQKGGIGYPMITALTHALAVGEKGGLGYGLTAQASEGLAEGLKASDGFALVAELATALGQCAKGGSGYSLGLALAQVVARGQKGGIGYPMITELAASLGEGQKGAQGSSGYALLSGAHFTAVFGQKGSDGYGLVLQEAAALAETAKSSSGYAVVIETPVGLIWGFLVPPGTKLVASAAAQPLISVDTGGGTLVLLKVNTP